LPDDIRPTCFLIDSLLPLRRDYPPSTCFTFPPSLSFSFGVFWLDISLVCSLLAPSAVSPGSRAISPPGLPLIEVIASRPPVGAFLFYTASCSSFPLLLGFPPSWWIRYVHARSYFVSSRPMCFASRVTDPICGGSLAEGLETGFNPASLPPPSGETVFLSAPQTTGTLVNIFRRFRLCMLVGDCPRRRVGPEARFSLSFSRDSPSGPRSVVLNKPPFLDEVTRLLASATVFLSSSFPPVSCPFP